MHSYLEPDGDAPQSLRDLEPSQEAVRREILHGLLEHPKRIAPKFFYDETGCKLFDEICQLNEYYPTRTETGILEGNIQEICAALGPECRVVEFGSGSGVKTRILLDHLFSPAAYVPVEIARAYLLQCAARLARSYPELRVLPVCADYTTDFVLPEPPVPARRTVAFFPGSTIGNLEPAEAERFLRRIAAMCGEGGGLLIGVDLKKDRDTLERAYNDSRGVTAAFNLNVLARINRTFNARIPRKTFRHHAFYNEGPGRIEMHLVSRVAQTVQLNGANITFERGEPIVTEHSYKYTLDGFAELAARSGWVVQKHWVDAHQWFSVQYLVTR
ncbi:MAG TPA: L-histidine N(alpha)-methyltransferase [Chthoniobacterales bacterium]